MSEHQLEIRNLHATVGDKLGNDQAMPRDQYCVSVRHQRAFLVERVLSQVPPNQ